MNPQWFQANDGCELFVRSQPTFATNSDPLPNKLIILLHGFSGSSTYFDRNFTGLAQQDPTTKQSRHWVVAPDLRGHGSSGKLGGDFHVARLAMDLHNLIAHLRHVYNSRGKKTPDDELEIVAVGCSIGAAILWTYTELFTSADFSGLVFVDQAPLQDAVFFGDNDPENWDATKHHKGCYNEATLQAAQKAWMSTDPAVQKATHFALVNECLGYRQAGKGPAEPPTGAFQDEDFDFFSESSSKCDGKWLAKLMADHTRYDHREAIKRIDVPTLVMAGGLSGCFPLEGMLETAKLIESSGRGDVSVSVFEENGHWLFYENPERFNQEIVAFVDRCTK